ncbi:hypothetical protein Verru16b_00180 [Lacunisphaera limnophila]|uniref:Uncharacterized protein n=1 Tax=Lacunisphaera limnophila TaxID=1838286 RepID=A0A1I7PHP9_9BACT|nr:hypothetical protein [Lacunisphaera limnophila]AOS43139.1 hypothetical protein Verru16b_00180 [Lacunisphaera limnophila]
MKKQNSAYHHPPRHRCAALLFAGCAKNDREEVADKSKEVYQDTKTAVAAGWNNLKDFTFEKRNDFTATLKARQADLEAGMSKLRSEYFRSQRQRQPQGRPWPS